MAADRLSAESVLGTIFDDEYSLDESDSEDGEDVYGYLGEPVLRRSEIEAESLLLVERDTDGDWNEDAVAGEDHQSDECTDEEAVVRSEETALRCDEVRSDEEAVVRSDEATVRSDEATVRSDGSDSSQYHRVTGATVNGHSSNEDEMAQDEVVRSHNTE